MNLLVALLAVLALAGRGTAPDSPPSAVTASGSTVTASGIAVTSGNHAAIPAGAAGDGAAEGQ